MSEAIQLHPASVLEAFKPYEHFARVMLDAYALVDKDGRIVKANQLFSQLVGKKTKEILKAGSFDELLTLDINNEILNIDKILAHETPTRIDEIRGKTATASGLNLIIGLYPFMDEGTQTFLGTFILIRDVTAETNLQDKYKHTAIKSITDTLTGLYTRAYFESWLEAQFRQTPESDENPEISIVMVDIDFFKKVNDVYGHQAGDHVLQTVGKIMKKTFRKNDIPCRYGGEEFLVILPNTPLTGAGLAAEKLRAAVEEEKMVFDGTHIPVTISCGVAQIQNFKENYQDTIKRADEALYTSKDSGRNLVSLHDGTKIAAAKK